jgi:hypothetical protein
VKKLSESRDAHQETCFEVKIFLDSLNFLGSQNFFLNLPNYSLVRQLFNKKLELGGHIRPSSLSRALMYLVLGAQRSCIGMEGEVPNTGATERWVPSI